MIAASTYSICTLSVLRCDQYPIVNLCLCCQVVVQRHWSTAQEDELASLRRSLQALSGPAQPYQTTPAVLGTSAGSGAPTKGDTGVFCESAQGKAAQIGPSGKASYQGCAPQRTAASASAQQPRPVISLVSSSLQQSSHSAAGHRRNPQLDTLQGPTLIQARAGPQQDQGGTPEQASSGKARPSGKTTQDHLHVLSGTLAPGTRAWQQRPPPCSSNEPGTQQRAQKVIQKALGPQPGSRQMQMQASRSAGEVTRRASRNTAEQLGPIAAVSLMQQQQHQGAADQSDGAGHPALTPPLEPVPYTVQEPDSPPSQLAGPRPDASAKQMPPTCIFMETTITRWDVCLY